MKKICILSAVNIKHMSLISLYTHFLEEHSIPYDIIYMDKYNEEEEINAKNIYRFVNPIEPTWSKVRKIIIYGKFYKYAKNILKQNAYDRIIVWNDVAIVMFGVYLARKWKKKYCLNCRDYSGERFPIIYYIFRRAITNSQFTTISSEGFKSFLPKHKYIDLYSFNSELLSECVPKQSLANDPIRIGFVGNVRFFEENYKLIQALKNDARFELHYHGTNAEIIENYAKSKGYNNIICSGSFPVNETKRYLENCDIINNVFGNNTIAVQTLTSIRLFHAAYMNMPILVSPNTYMQELVNQYSIGYAVSFDDDHLADNLYMWYRNLDFQRLKTNCEELIKEANEANNSFTQLLKEFLI